VTVLVALLSVASALAARPVDAIASAVAARVGVPVADVEVTGLGLPEDANVDAAWVVDLPAGQRRFTGATTVSLRREDAPVRFSLRPRVVTWHAVPVAERSVRAGEPVSLVTARVASDVLRTEDPVTGGRWVARVGIEAGAPVTTARVRPAPDLADGADVKLIAGTGALRVAAPGRLLSDAWVGAPVSVLNLATRAVLKGTYRGENTVALEGP
jgi:flagella basal body P-ring formation protein FlgA